MEPPKIFIYDIGYQYYHIIKLFKDIKIRLFLTNKKIIQREEKLQGL